MNKHIFVLATPYRIGGDFYIRTNCPTDLLIEDGHGEIIYHEFTVAGAPQIYWRETTMPTNNQQKTGAYYEIRVKDHLETYWTTFFDGWSIDNLVNGEVVLRNSNVDQAGLHGALNRIRDLNLTLLSVNLLKR